MISSINAIKGIPDISSESKSIISRVLGEITREIQAGKIRKHNEQLSKLSEAYALLWKDDNEVWQKHLDDSSKIVEAGIDGLKGDRFDLARLKDFIKEPYVADRNLLLFKRQEIEKIRTQREEIKSDLLKVQKAYDLLKETHAELQKEQPAIDNVLSFLTSIKYVLGEIK